MSVFAEAYIKEEESDAPIMVTGLLKLESIVSLEDLMEGKNSVTFDHCSMFIDIISPHY